MHGIVRQRSAVGFRRLHGEVTDVETKILIRAGLKKHRGSLIGIGILVFIVSLALATVLTVWSNSNRYIRFEMERAGFGQLTAWVSNLSEPQVLADEISAQQTVKRAEVQNILFSNYEVNGQESDSEGQLILYRQEENRYKFFGSDLSGYRWEAVPVEPGDVYVSPSLISMFGVQLGDEIVFPITRNSGNVTLTVKGFYEDPFMGSAMIGMKGFLISEADYLEIRDMIESAGIDALARAGAMLHIFADEGKTAAELNQSLNEQTPLGGYTEFVHSADAISGFMLILQRAFCSLIAAFALVLLFAAMVVLGHSMGSTIEADYVNMGILKTMGFTGRKLRDIQLMQYLLPVLLGIILGGAFSVPLAKLVNSATLTTVGVLVPSRPPLGLCFLCFALIFGLLLGFILLKTRKIGKITPMQAIRNGAESVHLHNNRAVAIDGKSLSLTLAIRQLSSEKRNYVSACLVAVLLVFFASLVGRMDAWLDPDGKGMMDAFNPADHDLGVQIFGDFGIEDAEEVIHAYSDTTDSYRLAMPSVLLNGKSYAANVITEPERFHIMDGRTSMNDDEIVLTEFAAADLGVSIGDTLTVAGDLGQAAYTVSGIYTCANDMGDNVGMSREGYLKIGQDDPRLWCYHYFLADPGQKAAIAEALERNYGGDVHVHENTWPGLFGIISAMQGLLALMYGMVIAFILIVTMMTSSKLLSAEQKDLGIYKAIGFSTNRLRLTFALRFSVVAVIGSAVGTTLATVLTDPLVNIVMKLAGISSFESHPGIGTIFFPTVVVILLFTFFAYLAAGKMKEVDLTTLISEN